MGVLVITGFGGYTKQRLISETEVGRKLSWSKGLPWLTFDSNYTAGIFFLTRSLR